MPGLSRSGLTTSIMLLNKYTSENAFRLSFLMSIPASFAAAFGLMLLKDFSLDPFTAFSSLVAAIIGYITIGGLLKVARAVSFWKICVALGVLTIIIWLPVLTV